MLKKLTHRFNVMRISLTRRNRYGQNIIGKISNFKFQLIINKNLYIDEVITKEIYEIMENNLLEKIHTLSDELEMCN